MKQSIADIKSRLEQLTQEELSAALSEYVTDERFGVQQLLLSYQKKAEKLQKEMERIENMRVYEKKYEHLQYVAGIDEVGRGPLAGPVVTACVTLPIGYKALYINDSKKLSEEKRNELYDVIQRDAIAIGIGMVHSEAIDEINILNATYFAMKQAVEEMKIRPSQLLVDALTIPYVDIPQEGIIKGDEKSISIAAASIIAKVTRDRMMESYDLLFPGYQFAKNKGYGTAEHIEALKRLGPCPIHRASFIKNFVE